MVTALRHGSFRRIAALYSAEHLLGWFTAIAMMVAAYGATSSTIGAGAMLLCRQVVPGIVVAIAGARLDSVDLRRAVTWGFAVQAATLVTLGLAGYGVWLYPLAVASGLAGSIGRASLRASVARVLDGPDLRGANALLNVVTGIAAPVGPALAALAVGGAGASAVLVAAGFVTAGLVVPSRRLVVGEGGGAASVPGAASPEASASRDAGVRVETLLLVVGLVACLVAMDEPALLAYAEHELHAGVRGYGAIFMAWGLGITIGSLLFTRLLGRSMLHLFIVSMAVAGAAYIGLGLAPGLAVAAVVSIIGGAGNGVAWVAVVTSVQEGTPAGREGWAASRLEAIGMACPGVGIVAGSVVAELWGPRISLLLPGVLILAVLLTVFGLLRLRESTHDSAARTTFIPSIQGGSA